jgi:DUF4097 and DUF4098 domain-containing protein YvlB
MTLNRPALSVLLASMLSAGASALPAAQQMSEGIPVPFSDPARIGSVSVRVHDGSIVVRGENRKDVLVTSSSNDESRNRKPVPPGFQRVSSAGVTITEENNRVQINASMNRQTRLEIRVPTRVNLTLSGHNGSGIEVDNVEGDIEADHHNASIQMSNVGGSVVADTHNGDIRVVLTRITSDKPMSFISWNGTVDVTLPATTKANLKLRSSQGDIYTQFEMQLRPGAAPQLRTDGRTRVIDASQSVLGAINGGGPEFELRTWNGDIFVRKGAQ